MSLLPFPPTKYSNLGSVIPVQELCFMLSDVTERASKEVQHEEGALQEGTQK
jgi:hypothetical protein